MALTDRVKISWDCGPKGIAGQGGKASTGGSCAQLTAGNIAAQDTALIAWETAAIPLSQGTAVGAFISHGVVDTSAPPTTPLNKGEKWVITMQENGGNARIFTHSIPAADETGTHKLPNTLNWDPTDADWIAYVTASEAFLTTPDGGAMTLRFATLLTRRR